MIFSRNKTIDVNMEELMTLYESDAEKPASFNSNVVHNVKEPPSSWMLKKADGTRLRTKSFKDCSVALMIRLIVTFSKRDDLIFSAFAGASQDAFAAMMTNRRWVGTEQDEQIYTEAMKRLLKWLEAQLKEQEGSAQTSLGVAQLTFPISKLEEKDYGAHAFNVGASHASSLETEGAKSEQVSLTKDSGPDSDADTLRVSKVKSDEVSRPAAKSGSKPSPRKAKVADKLPKASSKRKGEQGDKKRNLKRRVPSDDDEETAS